MKKVFCFISSLLLLSACKEVYKPALHSPATGYLVVEGFINSGEGETAITLSRTVKAEDVATINYEHNAVVSVEGENNESYQLIEGLNGVYASSGSLNLNNAEKYRLHIRTSAGQEYVSDFTAVKYTPPIDSITWQRDNGGVRIYVSTHDATNNTRYYQWKYTETWEFHSRYIKTLDYQFDPVTNDVTGVGNSSPSPDTTIYKCWQTRNSSDIIIGTSEKLSTDKIYLPINYIQPDAEELTVLYHIKLQQYALSHQAYLFYQQIKKNTEQLGTIFDPQPTELNTNIHCISDPSESVIGYVEVSQEQSKELFIYNSEVSPWVTGVGCSLIVITNKADSIKPYVYGYTAVQPVTFRGLAIATFSIAPLSCVDCTLRGSNIRPSYWP
ncbi:hypothetical protein BH11BAC6_BH11BAC6_11210 [soil metagenome]